MRRAGHLRASSVGKVASTHARSSRGRPPAHRMRRRGVLMTATRHRGRQRRTPDAALTVELAELSARIREQQQALRALEEPRNRLVKRAIAKGWTHAQIAEATGLTRGRIGQIASGR